MNLLSHLLENFSQNTLFFFKQELEKALIKKLPRKERLQLFYDKRSQSQVWGKVLPPGRPSKGDIEIYHHFASKITEQNKILILGSTAELRDLSTELAAKNYIMADFSILRAEGSLELSKQAQADNEIWIKSNWLDLPLPENSIDFIFGDLVLWQFLPAEQDKFLEKICSFLKPGGHFLTRTHVVNLKLFPQTPNTIIEEVFSKIGVEDDTALQITLTVSRLRDKFRDEKTKTTDPSALLNALSAYFTRNEREARIIEKAIHLVTKRQEEKVEYVTQTEEETELLFRKYFKVEDKKNATDYLDADFFPIYNLKK